jgi:hypothetical protein
MELPDCSCGHCSRCVGKLTRQLEQTEQELTKYKAAFRNATQALVDFSAPDALDKCGIDLAIMSKRHAKAELERDASLKVVGAAKERIKQLEAVVLALRQYGPDALSLQLRQALQALEGKDEST